MNPPPAFVLNRVAQARTLKTRAGTVMFTTKQKELDRALTRQMAALDQAGHRISVIAGYQNWGRC